MKKVCKILIVFLIIFNIYLMFYTASAKDIWSTGDAFITTGELTGGLGEWIGKLYAKATMVELIDFIWGLGLLVVVISTVVLGIKYMLVLPSEKSRIKQATTPYIIGVIVIFGAVTIWKLIIQVLDA